MSAAYPYGSSPQSRAAALGLAAMATLLPFAMLLSAFGRHAIDTPHRDQPALRLFVVPEPPPPPELPVTKPKPATRVAATAQPAPSMAAPAPVPTPIVPVAPTLPAPSVSSPLDLSGTGAAGSGHGTGGTGSGGAGGRPRLEAAPKPTPVRFAMASWKVRPTDEELAEHNPDIAARNGIDGTILLACHIQASGRPTGCRVLAEKPRGFGFGRAALAAARGFRINPPMRDDMVDEAAWIGIPVAFNNRR